MTTQNEETTETPEISAEDILEEVLAAAEVHAELAETFVTKFSFYGKTLDTWSRELSIKIPDELTQDEMRSLYIKLANSIQRASHFYSVSNTVNTTLVGGGEIKKSDLVAALVRQYEIANRRKPSGEVIGRLADSYLSSTVSAKIASKIVKEFWRQHLDALIEVRKCLEQIGISLHTELKYSIGE